jgi:hypothetical protein
MLYNINMLIKSLQQDFNENACFKLVSATIRQCFFPYRLHFPHLAKEMDVYFFLKDNEEIIKTTSAIRLKFADSKMLKMFCDCSNFEFNKLRKLIINYQIKEIKECNLKLSLHINKIYKQLQYGKGLTY